MSLSGITMPLRRLRLRYGASEVGSGLDRARSFMILATLLYRMSHLLVGVLAVTQLRRGHPVQYAGVALAVGLSVLTFGAALQRGWFDRWHVGADVLLAGCVLPFVLWAWGGSHSSDSLGWAMLIGTSGMAVAAIALDRLQALAALVLLALTHLIAYFLVDARAGVLVGHLNSLVSSAAIAGIFWWYLRRQGHLLDEANVRAVEAEVHRARYAERLAHHRALHDTVLATLTALAAGGIDGNSSQVRERCAREAAYLRRLIQRTSDELPHHTVGAALEEAVGSVESLGLRVTTQYHALPEVPPATAAALADATREALNNVRRHAGTGYAFLTAAGSDDGGIVITVVDRGTGFDLGNHVPGLGLRLSVYARMTEAGGRASVDSAPGEGARVELRWPT